MKKYIWSTIAIIMAVGTIILVSCNKESIDNATAEQVPPQQTKVATAPDPSWARVTSAGSILRSKTLNPTLCYEILMGYFCGFKITYPLATGPFTVYHGSGSPYGLQVSNSYLTTNNLSALIDSAKHGYLTLHDDIDIMDTSMQSTLGFTQIPADRYPAMLLGDSAIYIQF